MPRLRFIEEHEKDDLARTLIAESERKGAPDPRIASIACRAEAGKGWVAYWNKLLYEGLLPHKLKEMCRIKISVAHHCGYCSTVRSKVAMAEGLDEALIAEIFDYERSTRLTPREKAALRYADLFKKGDDGIDSDAVYADLKQQFSEEEIIELGMLCAQTDGVGKFARSMNIVSWEEACALNPALRGTGADTAQAAE